MKSETKEDVVWMLRAGQKNNAVIHVKDTFRVSMEDAIALVDAVEHELGDGSIAGMSAIDENAALDKASREAIIALLQDGKKIEAINLVKNDYQKSLKEAVEIVEAIDQQLEPSSIKKSSSGGRSIVPIIFGSLTILLMSIAGFLLWRDHQLMNTYHPTKGTVVELIEKNDTYSPRVSYTWQGNDYIYVSSSSSNPPAYDVDEEVTLYVNPDNPDEAFIDSITDRWLGIMIVGGIAIGFTFFTVLFAFKSRRF